MNIFRQHVASKENIALPKSNLEFHQNVTILVIISVATGFYKLNYVKFDFAQIDYSKKKVLSTNFSIT